MKEILETRQLEFFKSGFLIDLVKHDNGKLYIEIVQVIGEENEGKQTIKINPSILSDFLRVLEDYKAKIPNIDKDESNYLTEIQQQSIQDRYLKGVPIKGLALQFDQEEELIEMVLRNRGIQIVPYEIPKKTSWKKRKY